MNRLSCLFISACLSFTLVNCNPKTQAVPSTSSSEASSVVTDTMTATDSSAVSSDTTSGIQEKYWKLTELMGKAVGPTPQDKKEIHIKFRSKENRLEGFGGCNGFGGTYELKTGDRITISRIISTQMACSELDIENELIRVLETADNYNLNGDKLVLNKARMAPLARFEAVYFN